MARQYAKIVVSVAFLLLGVLAILLLTIPTQNMNAQPDYMYGIVLDAGSSHTSLAIYKWPADKQNGTGVVTQHSECHVKGGGISSYAGQKGGAGRSLEACLDQAVQEIPKSRHHLTPVYLGATAGMRLLTISDPKVAKEILEEVGAKIKSYPFNFSGAAILSGQEEGAYGWVTVNYLLENFIKYGFVGRWLSSGRDTVGALDFGGASTQITFQTQGEVEDERNRMTLRLYGQDYHLYTHSYLCYGQDQMLRQLLAQLLQSQDYRSTVSHPCFPAGHSISMQLGKVFDSPCTADRQPKSYDPQAPLSVLGTGEYEQCLGNVSQLFDFKACPFTQCSFNKVFQPNVSGDFMAFAAFFYTHSFLKLTTGITVSNPKQLEAASRAVCGLTFQEMLAMAPDQKKRLHNYCPASVFIQVLLLQGYNFDELTLPHVAFQRKAGGASVGWALGYMLSLSNLIPEESVGLRKALHPIAWGFLIFLSVLLLVVALGYLYHHTSRRKDRDGSSV